MNPLLTRDQVRRVDHLAINRYGIAGVVLMENAGRNAAIIIDNIYGPAGMAFVVCGPGNNGGDGFVIARHLHNAGWSVRLTITGHESRMTPDALVNFLIIKAMGLDSTIAPDEDSQRVITATIGDGDLVIDALLGTGFRGEVRSPTSQLITALNAAAKRATVAIDVPSGLDCDSGTPSSTTIRADLTVTFVAQKAGFTSPSAKPYIGRVEVADIGAPRGLIAEVLAESA